MIVVDGNNKIRRSYEISICFLILICFAGSVFAQETPNAANSIIDRNREDYRLGRIYGKKEAGQSYSANRWVAAGWGSGFLLSVVGIGIVAGFSQGGKVYPGEELMIGLHKYSVAYQDGYLTGYSAKAKKKRLSRTIVGGIFGMAFSVALYCALVDNSD